MENKVLRVGETSAVQNTLWYFKAQWLALLCCMLNSLSDENTVVSLMMAILTCCEVITAVLTCIILIISGAKHLSTCLLAICICSLESCLSRSSACFFIYLVFVFGFFFLYWAPWVFWIFWKLILCPLLHLQIFSPILRIIFLSCLGFPLLCKSFFKFH